MGPIMAACYERDAVALRRALAAGGDVNVRARGGWTAIHILLYCGDHKEMVSMLLNAGLDVDACSVAYCTHLHLAISQGRVDCVAALLAAGASLTVIYNRCTPLEYVTNRYDNCRRIVPLLLRAGSDMPSLDRIEREAFPFCRPYGGPDHQILRNYLKKIRMSGPSPGLGTWTTYEKDHRARLTKTFVRLSAESNFRRPTPSTRRHCNTGTQVPPAPRGDRAHDRRLRLPHGLVLSTN